ncbi:MAG: JAB domain-containing protein [Dysgonamonadaceae bacterium]|nr:JAB domain-containing protein [Dysgonamonadaceae bacterium]
MKTYKSNLNGIRLVKEESEFKRVKITSSKDAAKYARNFFQEDIEIYESFFMILLNRANNTDAYVKISQGGIAGTVVDLKLIAKYAIDCLASGVIVCHNHPSGTLYPSEQDKLITEKIKNALKLLDIKLLDHIILTKDGHFSFADECLL